MYVKKMENLLNMTGEERVDYFIRKMADLEEVSKKA